MRSMFLRTKSQPKITNFLPWKFIKASSFYHLSVECFSRLSFDSEVYTKSTTAADFVYTSESNESCEKHSTQRWKDNLPLEESANLLSKKKFSSAHRLTRLRDSYRRCFAVKFDLTQNWKLFKMLRNWFYILPGNSCISYLSFKYGFNFH